MCHFDCLICATLTVVHAADEQVYAWRFVACLKCANLTVLYVLPVLYVPR